MAAAHAQRRSCCTAGGKAPAPRLIPHTPPSATQAAAPGSATSSAMMAAAPAAHQPLFTRHHAASTRTRRRVQAQVLPFFGQQKTDTPAQQAPPPPAPARFQLPLAVALAGAAFESYLEPTGADGFQERAINGSTTTFTDSEFLGDVYQGVLHVELLSAKGLRVADITGASDPYAVLTVGGSMGRSKVINATVNPKWNESFFLYVRDFQEDMLKVRLYDEDFLKTDDDLGVAQLALSSLQKGEGKHETVTLPLRGPGAQGDVTLRVTPLRFCEHILDLLTSDGTAVPTNDEPPEMSMDEASAKVVVAAKTPGFKSQQDLMEETRRKAEEMGAQIPGFTDLKDKLSRALDSVGLLGTSAGQVSKEEVAANPWKVLARMAGDSKSHKWVPVAFVENHESDTQAWLYRSKETREAIVAFRGTEQIKWKDLATDINLAPCTLNAERVDDSGPLKIFKAVVPTNEMMVHSGFLQAYDSIKPQVFQLLDRITNNPKDTDDRPWKVFITGHSLGGALATLCAYELAARKGPARARQCLTLYTFGAPRVGNKVFAAAYDALVPDSWRVTNARDIIPSVPRLLGYAHVQHSVRLSEDGKLAIQGDPGVADVFGEGKGGVDVLREFMDQVHAEKRTWEEVYEEIKAAELAILDTLVSGEALEQHMEDFYLNTLKQVVVASASAGVANVVATAAAAAEAAKETAKEAATGDGKGKK